MIVGVVLKVCCKGALSCSATSELVEATPHQQTSQSLSDCLTICNLCLVSVSQVTMLLWLAYQTHIFSPFNTKR